jgi:predicted metalloendopeptidase
MATPVEVHCVSGINFGSLWPASLFSPHEHLRKANLTPRKRTLKRGHNLDKWHDAFQPKADGKLYLNYEDRVRIW